MATYGYYGHLRCPKDVAAFGYSFFAQFGKTFICKTQRPLCPLSLEAAVVGTAETGPSPH